MSWWFFSQIKLGEAIVNDVRKGSLQGAMCSPAPLAASCANLALTLRAEALRSVSRALKVIFKKAQAAHTAKHVQ
jgi:hypothetical protein